MYTFDDGGGRSLTLRPEGTAPVCRAYIEHGMHKLPQPVKLWYLSSFFRAEAPQKRPLPPVLAGRRRGDRLGRRPETDAELIVLLAELLEALGQPRRAAAALEPRHARDARRLPRGAERVPARRTRTELSAGGPRAHRRSTRCARSTPTDPGTREVMADAPTLLDRLAPDDAEHFAARARAARRRRRLTTSSTRRSCAGSTTTRGRCSSSPATRSARSRASAAAAATTA